jgi:hypothetical protein
MAKAQKRSSREAKKPKADAKSKTKTPSYQAVTSLKDGALQASTPKKKG